MRLLAISGSLRSRSTNTALLRALLDLAPAGLATELYEGLEDIPPFNPDRESGADDGPVARFRRALGDATAVVFSTPEYAHGIPGALKNALDWVVGSGELSGKPVALVNASPRGAFAQASLREILSTMDARVVAAAEVTVTLTSSDLAPGAMALRQDLAEPLRASLAAIAAVIGLPHATEESESR